MLSFEYIPLVPSWTCSRDFAVVIGEVGLGSLDVAGVSGCAAGGLGEDAAIVFGEGGWRWFRHCCWREVSEESLEELKVQRRDRLGT